MKMHEASIYYALGEREGTLYECRFHLIAANDSEARRLARAQMRECYTGEVPDSAYVFGITWRVPGVTNPSRLRLKKNVPSTSHTLPRA